MCASAMAALCQHREAQRKHRGTTEQAAVEMGAILVAAGFNLRHVAAGFNLRLRRFLGDYRLFTPVHVNNR